MNIFSRINKPSEFGSKFIKMSPERNSVSGLLHSVGSMAEGRIQGTRVSGRRRSGHLWTSVSPRPWRGSPTWRPAS